MDTDRMNHEDFVQKYRSGKIGVRVDRNKAGFFYEKPGLMPQSLRKKQALLRAAAFGGVALGLALFFFVNWWIALLVVLLGLVMFPYCQKSAAKGVLAASLSDPNIYRIAFDSGVFWINEKEPKHAQ